MFYQRSKFAILKVVIFVTLLSVFGSGCFYKDLPPVKEIGVHKDFSVNYVDVGQGDCIYIRLPDGKNLLIDCGLNDENSHNSKQIITLLNKYSVEKIDYFILTHPDLDHIGTAKEIINNFSVESISSPIISDDLMDTFSDYKTLLEQARQKQIKIINSDYSCIIKEDKYVFAFLSPVPKGLNGSSYSEFESSLYPTDRQINDLSPIVYLECFNKRFVFTGDASSTQEKIVLENYKTGFYDLLYKNKSVKINLEDIDYLKVSHHGAVDASCSDFISLLSS